MGLSDIYGGNWLKAADLAGQAITIPIGQVTVEACTYENSKPGEQQIVLSFAGKDKRLGLNKTNARSVAEVLGTEDYNRWAGGVIELYPTRVDAFGEMKDAIRVRHPGASQPPVGATPPPPQSIAPAPPGDDVPF